jgi:AraC-like DNA-binding protein
MNYHPYRKTPMLETRTVSTTYLRTIISAVQACGISPSDLLRNVPLTLDQLGRPKERISASIAQLLWKRALALSAEPLLGLRVAEHTRPASFDLLGLATMYCGTLEQAFTLLVRYQRLVSEAGVLNGRHLPDGGFELSHRATTRQVTQLPQQVEAIVAIILRQARWLTGAALAPLRVAFRHPAQGNMASYVDSFGIAPDFDADTDTIVFRATDLQTPVLYSDADLCRMHCEFADRLLAGLPDAGHAASFAIHWLGSRPTGRSRLANLAAALGVSERSLQRQLKSEGYTWRQLLDEARRQSLATLLSQGYTLRAAARQLGYHDASSVSRAARRWFGSRTHPTSGTSVSSADALPLRSDRCTFPIRGKY